MQTRDEAAGEEPRLGRMWQKIGSKTLVLIYAQTREIEEIKERRKEEPDQGACDGSWTVARKKHRGTSRSAKK